MNDRASQEALEVLQAHEAQARRKVWGDAAKARLVAHKADSAPAARIWSPVLTPQQQQEHEQYVAVNQCPF